MRTGERVRIPRTDMERILKLARDIDDCGATDREGLGLAESYAHALGRCNSMGREIADIARIYLGTK